MRASLPLLVVAWSTLNACAAADDVAMPAGVVAVFDEKTDDLVRYDLFVNLEEDRHSTPPSGTQTEVFVTSCVHDIDHEQKRFTVDGPVVVIGQLKTALSIEHKISEVVPILYGDEGVVLLLHRHPEATGGQWVPTPVSVEQSTISIFSAGYLSPEASGVSLSGTLLGNVFSGTLPPQLVPSDSEFGLFSVPLVKNPRAVIDSGSLEGDWVRATISIEAE